LGWGLRYLWRRWDKIWSSYIDQVNADVDFNTLKADIDLAFRTGRAAIVANDYATRDAQIDIIKAKIALVPAVRAVFYLQEGKSKLTTDKGAKAFMRFQKHTVSLFHCDIPTNQELTTLFYKSRGWCYVN
jgi:hypothetical protein